jgi:hypothetical protein
MELACKSYAQTTLLLNFKITQRAFSLKPNFSNKSSQVQLLEYKKTGLTIFGFLYEFLQIFQDH